MILHFGGHEFFLHPSGALYWPSEKLLVVSDLHLEKGSHFALKGFFLPPYDSHHTLSLLFDVIKESGCSRLLLLGDSFHDDKAYERLSHKDRTAFDSLTNLNPIWIKGNHDKDYVPEGFLGVDAHIVKGITFRHEAAAGTEFEISGHFHPKTQITPRLSRPCFVEDGIKLIMPAFGAYTGGLCIDSAPFEKILKSERQVYALGKNKTYVVARAQIFKGDGA
jgi:uncharacterized protein